MKLNIIIAVLCSAFIFSCGKKENTDTNQTQQQPVTQQPPAQQNQQNTTKQDSVKKDNTKNTDATQKEADKKKEEELKKEADKKKEETKQPDNTQVSNIDFAPIFAKRCAKCHGKDARGKKDGGPNLTADSVQTLSSKKMHDIITNGVKNEDEEDNDMPSFKGKLTDDEIKAAVEYIKSLK